MMSSQEGGINPRVTLVGGVFAVASMIVWVTTTVGGACLYTVLPVRPLLVAWLPVPFPVVPVVNTGYSPWYMYVSELGIGPTASMVNAGWIVAGILVVPLFPALWGLFRESVPARVGIVFGVVGFASMIGVGLHPMVVSPLHIVFGTVSYVGTSVGVFLLSYVMLKTRFFSNTVSAIGFAYVSAGWIYLFTGLTIFEWSALLISHLWVLSVGVQMILNAGQRFKPGIYADSCSVSFG